MKRKQRIQLLLIIFACLAIAAIVLSITTIVFIFMCKWTQALICLGLEACVLYIISQLFNNKNPWKR